MKRLPLILLPLLIAPRVAHAAEAGETVARRQLIDAAEKAHKAGLHDVALEYVLRAHAIHSSPTSFLFIAEEQMELGQPVDAYANAQQCLREIELDLKAHLRDAAQARCQALVGKLHAQIGELVLNIPAPPPGTTLRLNGKLVKVEVAGVPFPVAPGSITVEAGAPGYDPFKADVTVSAGEAKPVFVVLRLTPCPAGATRDAEGTCRPALQAGGPAPSTASGARGSVPEAGRVSNQAATTGADQPRRPFLSRRTAVIGGAIAAALLVGGGAAWLVANSKYDTVKETCDRGCTPDQRSSGISTVQSWERIAAVGLIAGGTLAVGAVVTFMVSRPGGPESGSRLSLGIDPRGRLSIGGSF
ncbi:MAG TPA: hypothetical protein VFH68_02745 [Polyangia bacterium]|jgi:hypothetical protein|nr:hypothetical protein [Polyangia bacterium]